MIIASHAFLVMLIAFQSSTDSWPATIALMTEEQSQAKTCVGLLKSGGDAAAVNQGRVAYELARAASDVVVAGFTTLLLEHGAPESAPSIQSNLERAAAGLKEVCGAAVKVAADAANTRGVWDQVIIASIAPVADALKRVVGVIYTKQEALERNKLEMIKAQLSSAKWPAFDDIDQYGR